MDDPDTEPASRPSDTEGGDAVCWLDRLCPECGAMPTESTSESGEEPDRCWRCGWSA